MAVPSYTTDLTTINQAESVTGYTEPTGATVGGIAVAETDFFIQNTGCISKTFNGTGLGGLHYNNGSGVTIPTDGAYIAWCYFGAPNAIDTLANGGMRLTVGSGVGDYKMFYVRGSDTYAYGGWVCIPVDPTLTADATQGSPTSTRQYFGMAINAVNAIAKGNPFGFDVIRYGRCEARIADGSVADGFATWNGFAATNDTLANRWGLIQAVQGGYLMQGLVVLGYSTAVDFRDSNKIILIADTTKVSAAFNAIEIRNASSRVDMTAISVTALGTVARGNWITTDNADVNLNACVFTDMGTFGFLSASEAVGCIFRRCNLVTQGGATLTNCTFDRTNDGTRALTATNPTLVSGCTFVSSGTKHGMEITGAASNWTLTNDTWTGYASSDGSTGNEAIYVNIASGTVNLTITGGTTPSIRTAGATVNVIAGAVAATVKCTTVAGANIANVRVLVTAAAGGPFPFDVTVTIANSGTTATVTHTAHAMLTNDKVQIKGASHMANNGVFTITKIDANSYSYTMGSAPGSNPTGTIKATYAVLSGLTDANGEITMSRVFSSAQPITGRARKSTASPFYKTAGISGTVSSTLGYSATVQLIPDE